MFVESLSALTRRSVGLRMYRADAERVWVEGDSPSQPEPRGSEVYGKCG